MIKPEDILEAVEFSNFAMFFKAEIWKRLEGGFLPESSLDEIAKLLWDYQRKQKAPLLGED